MEAIDLLLSRRSVLAGNLTEPGPSPAELETILTAGLRVPGVYGPAYEDWPEYGKPPPSV